MVDGLAEVVSKPEFLEVSHTDLYSHVRDHSFSTLVNFSEKTYVRVSAGKKC